MLGPGTEVVDDDVLLDVDVVSEYSEGRLAADISHDILAEHIGFVFGAQSNATSPEPGMTVAKKAYEADGNAGEIELGRFMERVCRRREEAKANASRKLTVTRPPRLA
eukprot:1374876-Amphidinium_carterae.1